MQSRSSLLGRTVILKQLSKFLTIGVLNALIDLVILNVLLYLSPNRTPFDLMVCNSVAVTCAMINSYVCNRLWTFSKSSDGSLRELLSYGVQAGINLIINDLVTVYTSRWLILYKALPMFVSSNMSKGLAMMISSVVSFLCMRLFVFRRKRGEIRYGHRFNR